MKTDIKTNIQPKILAIDGISKSNLLKLLKFENQKPTQLRIKTTGK